MPSGQGPSQASEMSANPSKCSVDLYLDNKTIASGVVGPTPIAVCMKLSFNEGGAAVPLPNDCTGRVLGEGGGGGGGVIVCSTDRHCLYKHLHSGPLLSPTGHSVPPYTQQLLKLEATTPVCLPAALLEITTPLISKVWEHELATHPDQSFASYVVNGIKRGFRVSYDHTRTRASSESNMASAIEHPDVVSDYRWTAWWSFLSHKFHIFIAT